MAMYFFANKISAIACGTRCKQTVLQKSRGQRDRDKDKYQQRHRSRCPDTGSDNALTGPDNACCDLQDEIAAPQPDMGIFALAASSSSPTAETILRSCDLEMEMGLGQANESTAQLSGNDLELGFQQIEALATNRKAMEIGNNIVQYDVPNTTPKRSQCDNNFEISVLGSGDIMYINGRIVSGPLDSFTEVLIPKHVTDMDRDFMFSFLLSSRLFLRPHELLGKLVNSVPEGECLKTLVALLAEWTQKLPYDYRDELIMNHVKHIVARCSNTHLEATVSQVLSVLLQRLTDLERHEANLLACQFNNEKPVARLNCSTATQYAQILCRLEKKLAKHIGPEEFLQCSSLVLEDKQQNWDQPSMSSKAPGAQDPKKTCNLETYLDWSARLRLFVCNEILQCSGIEDRSRTVELWSGVAQYCLLVGNYNSATTILESLETPAIARLQITWSKLQMTCQQLDCMQRHAEGHGHLWQKQAIILYEPHYQQQKSPKTDKQAALLISQEPSTATTMYSMHSSTVQLNLDGELSTCQNGCSLTSVMSTNPVNGKSILKGTKATSSEKPNEWVVIPVFLDIVKLALAERKNCLQRLPNGHIDINAFERMGSIVGAFTKHMHLIKSTEAPSSGELQQFFTHMQQTTKLAEADLMTASFNCEAPSNAEKLRVE